jgi:DNA-binding CsgD family transcriptional regulator
MLQEHGAINAFIAELNPGGLITPVYQFGFTEEQMESWKVSTIEDDLPSADALKTNDFVWLADNEDWIRDYPNLVKFKYPNAETFICWPIHVRGSYMSIMGIVFGKVVNRTHECQNYLETIGGLIGLQISSLKKLRVSVDEDSNVWNLLSNRQHKIVTMISEGRTNNQIAQELGYSQSTIRQETIKIYEILGVAGRKGAAAAFRSTFPAFAHTSST